MNQQYTALPPVVPTSNMAIISLISGILSWVLLPFIAAIVAVITGHMAKNEIKNSAGTLSGNGMATAGLILGYVQLALGLCLCIGLVMLLALGVTIPYFNTTTQ